MSLYSAEIEKYTEWYRALQPGDEVWYQIGSTEHKRVILTKVDHVTPTGMVRTEEGELFDSSGWRRGGRSYYTRARLEAVTDAVRERISRKNAIDYIRAFDDKWSNVPTTDLLKVLDILSKLPEAQEADVSPK